MKDIPQNRIRNFCIIAHIDHGKSTIADCLLESTNAVSAREAKSQFLDSMDIERERGITIKAQTVSVNYTAQDKQDYLLNLIDTPGHVDFTYEVSRAISSCEGALLIVDAAQGVQAQTLANVYLAIEHNLEIIIVLNKIDLPSADPERVKKEIENIIGIDAAHAIKASAKEGIGIAEILERIVSDIPAPQDAIEKPLKASIFDSWFDSYLGIVVLFRIFEGEISKHDRILLMQTKKEYSIVQLGKFTPNKIELDTISAGEVGFLAASIKQIGDIKIGDTITLIKNPASEPLAGYEETKRMVFSGIYPIDSNDYPQLQDALLKLALNDASISFEPESSAALGFGYRCGFLGLLHMEIIQERLEREFQLELLMSAPTVVYQVNTQRDGVLFIDNPSQLPSPEKIEYISEPYINGIIYTPEEFVGAIMKICQDRRGMQKSMTYIGENRVSLSYELPLSEVITDFYNEIKSYSKGYASFDYELSNYQVGKLVKIDILINGEPVDALSTIMHRDKAETKGRELIKKLKALIPKQMFEVAIQAAIGSKIIARETVSAMRKNVTAKCYGGDISRKRKLLEKQKEGKKKMKRLGSVEIPKEAFMAVLKIKSE